MINVCGLQRLLDKTRAVDFLGPLALRLYLAPIFWMAGKSKFDDTFTNRSKIKFYSFVNALLTSENRNYR